LQELDRSLWYLSGGDITSLLHSYLFERREGKKQCQLLKLQEEQKKTKKLMEGLKALVCHTPEKDRPQILSVASSVFSHEQLRTNFDLVVSKKSFWKSRKHAKTQGIGKPTKKVTKTPISKEVRQVIHDFFYDERISREAANRTRIVKDDQGNKTTVPARYLQCYLNQAYNEYLKNDSNPSISFSTFKKFKPVEILKPKRDTDLCGICKEGKLLENRLKNLEAKEHCSSGEAQEIKELLSSVSLFHEHRELEKQIRTQYNNQKQNLKQGNAMIVMDFKENVTLGKGQQETNRDFYNTPQRSILCIAVIYRPHNDAPVRIKYFDFVSECLTHDTTYVKESLEILFASSEWKSLRITGDISFWMDNGPQHFRTFEFLSVFVDLSKRFVKSSQKLTLNYFVEYHGKCICDSHFSLLSRYYRDYSQFNEFKNPIYTTKQFIHLLETAIAKTNRSATRSQQIPELQVKFFHYKRDRNPVSISQVCAPGFGSYYHFALNRDYTRLESKLHSLHQTIHSYKISVKEKLVSKKPVKLGWADSKAKPQTMNTIERKKLTRTKHVLTASKPKKTSTSTSKQPSPLTALQSSFPLAPPTSRKASPPSNRSSGIPKVSSRPPVKPKRKSSSG